MNTSKNKHRRLNRSRRAREPLKRNIIINEVKKTLYLHPTKGWKYE